MMAEKVAMVLEAPLVSVCMCMGVSECGGEGRGGGGRFEIGTPWYQMHQPEGTATSKILDKIPES